MALSQGLACLPVAAWFSPLLGVMRCAKTFLMGARSTLCFGPEHWLHSSDTGLLLALDPERARAPECRS